MDGGRGEAGHLACELCRGLVCRMLPFLRRRWTASRFESTTRPVASTTGRCVSLTDFISDPTSSGVVLIFFE